MLGPEGAWKEGPGANTGAVRDDADARASPDRACVGQPLGDRGRHLRLPWREGRVRGTEPSCPDGSATPAHDPGLVLGGAWGREPGLRSGGRLLGSVLGRSAELSAALPGDRALHR